LAVDAEAVNPVAVPIACDRQIARFAVTLDLVGQAGRQVLLEIELAAPGAEDADLLGGRERATTDAESVPDLVGGADQVVTLRRSSCGGVKRVALRDEVRQVSTGRAVVALFQVLAASSRNPFKCWPAPA
jgi:hypothetical protein